MLDYDGTIAPFHTDRNRAYPYPGVLPILQKIIHCERTRVIFISGRPLAELRTLLTPMNGVEMWGSHGLEHQLNDGSYRRVEVDEESAATLAAAERWVIAAGLMPRAEIKLGGIAIHWRGIPPAKTRSIEAQTLAEWTPLASRRGLKLLRFEGGLELRVSHPDKGDAVRSVLTKLDPDLPVAYLGDDLTDEDAFRALAGRGLSVLVREANRETDAEARITPPQELIDFLEQWLNRISA